MLKDKVSKPSLRSPRLGSPKGELYSESNHRVKCLNFSLFSPSRKKKDPPQTNQNLMPTATSLSLLKMPIQINKEESRISSLDKKLKDIQHSYQSIVSEIKKENEEKYQSCLDLANQLENIHEQKKKKLVQQIKSVKEETLRLIKGAKSIPSLREKALDQNKELRAKKQEYVNRLRASFQKEEEKEQKLLEIKCELQNVRDVLEYYQRLQLKEKKRIKQLTQILDKKLTF